MKRNRSENQVVVDRIAGRVGELVDGWTTAETQWVRSADGSRLEPTQHVIEHEPLLRQLEMLDSVGGGQASSEQGPRPPISVPAFDALAMIRREVRTWVQVGLGHAPAVDRDRAVRPGSALARVLADADRYLLDSLTRVDVPGEEYELTPRGVLLGPAEEPALARDLRRLAREAWTLSGRNSSDDRGEPDDLHLLDYDVLRWWGHARLVTRWDSPPTRPHVPCMQCGKVGKIQVRFNPTAAVCFECGATWDQASIGILGSHIKLAMELLERPTLSADEDWWKRLAPWMETAPTMTSGGRP